MIFFARRLTGFLALLALLAVGFDSTHPLVPAPGFVPISAAQAQQAPRGIDPAEAARRDREERIKREKARTDNVNCFLRERKRESDQTITCLYSCPTLGGRTDSVSVGAGGSCPNTLGVLRRP